MHTRQKEQRLLGRNLISLDSISIKADHLVLSPFWLNTSSDSEIQKIIHQEVRKLSIKERRVIKFRHIEQKLWYDVAKKVGYSRQWCIKLEHDALDRLRKSEVLQNLLVRLNKSREEIN